MNFKVYAKQVVKFASIDKMHYTSLMGIDAVGLEVNSCKEKIFNTMMHVITYLIRL